MAYMVEVTSRARKNLREVPAGIQRKLIRRMEGLAENPRPAGAKKLQGLEDTYRIRVGDYRVVYEIKDDELVVLVIRVRHRRDVYRGL
jgi:mRNA interferase RelE/StbE